MALFELKLPKMGESIAEATITSWLKDVGDAIDIDDAIVEVATDKVDSEVPSEVEGTLLKILFEKDSVVKVGDTIAIIETDKEDSITNIVQDTTVIPEAAKVIEETILTAKQTIHSETPLSTTSSNRFYTPLVKNIAQKEGITLDELDKITGTGKDNRVTKNDILTYIESKNIKVKTTEEIAPVKEIKKQVVKEEVEKEKNDTSTTNIAIHGSDEVIEMSRMGKLVAKHMVDSVKTSAHVQSFIEIDVTNIVNWRNKVKEDFYKREGVKLTFTPIFMQAVAKTVKEYPMINISFDGERIIKRGNVNLGMAAALPDGNLIVPVIKNADQLNLVGIAKQVNDLAVRARANKLKPDEIQGGTYTVTNVGSFGSITGTPIINQPQVAILALGAIVKKPAVIESVEGDFIGIRNKMIVCHSYDHRVVNGALGGMFIKTLKDILENWNVNQSI